MSEEAIERAARAATDYGFENGAYYEDADAMEQFQAIIRECVAGAKEPSDEETNADILDKLGIVKKKHLI